MTSALGKYAMNVQYSTYQDSSSSVEGSRSTKVVL